MDSIVRARRPKRIPVVFTREEARRILSHLDGPHWLMASLLYGSGLRLMECLRLRIKDVDTDRQQITVRNGKGYKNRVTVLPSSLLGAVEDQKARVLIWFQMDRKRNTAGVSTPYALSRKYPNAATSWPWQFMFPARGLCEDPPHGPAPETSHRTARTPTRGQTGTARRTHREARQLPYLSPLFRHAFARVRIRHPHRAGTTGSQRREDDNDLHACVEQGRQSGTESPGLRRH